MNPLNFVLFSVMLGSAFAAESLYCKNKLIYDAGDKEFVIRGINSANADWDNWGRDYAINSFDAIAKTGANTIRVQWRHCWKEPNNADKARKCLSDAHLQKVLAKIKSLGLIAIIELHDATGSNDPKALIDNANWFAQRINYFNQYKRNVILNIANEWSTFGTAASTWANAYKQPISIIRKSGWNGIILVDGPAYAQDPTAIISHGQELVNHDPKKNLVFSLHTYADWKKTNGRYNPTTHFKAIQDKNLCLILGEFADAHPSKEGNSCPWYEMNWEVIMREANNRKIGWLGWSWMGNGNDECGKPLGALNMISGDQNNGGNWKVHKFTTWGNRIVNGAFGIKATSRKASAV